MKGQRFSHATALLGVDARAADRGAAVSRFLLLVTPLLAMIPWMAGCDDDECIGCVDRDPPAVPTGVFSVTGNGRVTVYWYDIYQSDLAGYLVYRNEDGGTRYTLLAELPWRASDFDAATGLYRYVDLQVLNGHTYYYAVSAYDTRGNESELSFEDVFDTPRPEGFDVELFNHAGSPNASGFDFSDLQNAPVPGGAAPADIRVEWEAGVPFVQAVGRSAPGAHVALQGYGSVMNDAGFINLDWLSYAPLDGYSTTGRAELILGHAYVVRIVENPINDVHYAKFAVKAVRTGSVVIDWAYQVAEGNRELKAPPLTQPAGNGGETELVRF